ncbi:MAG: hypothetical protein J6X58_03690 [Bacteroidales bacterium]|nr:hypothetical protein [Bacteroidales bacterium]
MIKTLLIGTIVCILGMMTACGIAYDGELLIKPSNEMQTDTLVAADTTSYPSSAEVSLKGYTKDTLYILFSNGCFWKAKLIGDIDTTYRDDWYDEYLPFSYHTNTSNDGDSIVLKYWIL